MEELLHDFLEELLKVKKTLEKNSLFSFGGICGANFRKKNFESNLWKLIKETLRNIVGRILGGNIARIFNEIGWRNS